MHETIYSNKIFLPFESTGIKWKKKDTTTILNEFEVKELLVQIFMDCLRLWLSISEAKDSKWSSDWWLRDICDDEMIQESEFAMYAMVELYTVTKWMTSTTNKYSGFSNMEEI